MTHIQEIVAARQQAEQAAKRHKAEVNASIEQMLGLLLFIACFGTGLFVAKVIDDFHGPVWAAVLAMAISAGAFLFFLKRLGRS